MSNEFHVKLDTLLASLDVEEDGRIVHYSIDLDPERKDALIERAVMSNESDEVIQRNSALMTLDQLRGLAQHDIDWARADHVVWAARGMWGIPLRFTPAPPVEPESEPSTTESQVTMV